MNENLNPEPAISVKGTKITSKYFLACIGVFLAVVVICSGITIVLRNEIKKASNNFTDKIPFTSNQTDEQKAEKKFDKPQKINSTVIVGKVEWRLTSSREINESLKSDSEDSEYCKPAEGNEYVLIAYSVRNVDRVFITVPKDNIEIYDSVEAKYTPSSKIYKCVLNDDNLGDKYIPDILKVDDKKEYQALYEVSKDSKGFRMKVGDFSITGKEFNYISLGF